MVTIALHSLNMMSKITVRITSSCTTHPGQISLVQVASIASEKLTSMVLIFRHQTFVIFVITYYVSVMMLNPAQSLATVSVIYAHYWCLPS